jgi:hypothetical protein
VPLYAIAVVSAAALTTLESEGHNDEVAAFRKALAVGVLGSRPGSRQDLAVGA